MHVHIAWQIYHHQQKVKVSGYLPGGEGVGRWGMGARGSARESLMTGQGAESTDSEDSVSKDDQLPLGEAFWKPPAK